MKGPSPLLGFNTNVRYKGKVFHVQTEDSGIGHPHIITHLFADGGRILKSKKTSYAEHLDLPNMTEVVRKMMQEQHKDMLRLLNSGAAEAPAEGSPSRQVDVPAEARAPVTEPAPHAAAPEVAPAEATPAAKKAPSEAPKSPKRSLPPPVPPATATPSPRGKVMVQGAPPTPPPVAPPPVPAAAPPGDPGRSSRVSVDVRPVIDLSPGRYSSRSPDIFRTPDAEDAPASLFGDKHISEKSLDEVILSYLAEDLEEK